MGVGVGTRVTPSLATACLHCCVVAAPVHRDVQLVFLLPQLSSDGQWMFWPILNKELKGCPSALGFVSTAKERYILLGNDHQVRVPFLVVLAPCCRSAAEVGAPPPCCGGGVCGPAIGCFVAAAPCGGTSTSPPPFAVCGAFPAASVYLEKAQGR